jgi:monovalent cation:H+ antiporter, CPA1 family
MELIRIFTIVLVLSASFAYINERFIKFPSTIGLMILSLGLSIVIQFIGVFSPDTLASAKTLVETADFSDVLLDFMLSFLLFAGALHMDWSKLHQARGPIITFATLGVIISTLIIGSILYYLVGVFGITVPFIHCVLFGALISPTDPIAVMGILKKAKVPESTEVKIVGESLFNDGTGVVLFISLLRIAQKGMEQISISEISFLFLEEIGGGIGFGLALGYLGYWLMKSIDHYQTEVMITLALVVGGYLLANSLHFSGPLAMVTAGIFIGNRGKEKAMSDTTLDYTFKFWEMVDEILNAALFVLIGLELLIIPFQWEFLWIGVICIPLVLLTRYGSLAMLSFGLGYKKQFEPKTLSIMTWGGLRGGISIALALSIPATLNGHLFILVTYVIVLFSIIVQGLTLQSLIKRLMK